MWNLKHPMNDVSRSRNGQNRFSTFPAPDSFNRTTPREINLSHNCTRQYKIPCLFSNPKLWRTGHSQRPTFPSSTPKSEFQCQVFSHQSKINRFPLNRMQSARGIGIKGKDGFNFETPTNRFRQKGIPQRPCHRSSSENINMANHYPPKINSTRGVLLSGVPFKNNQNPPQYHCIQDVYHPHKRNDGFDVNFTPRSSPTTAYNRVATSDQIRRLHDTFHKMNSLHKSKSLKDSCNTDQKQEQVQAPNPASTHQKDTQMDNQKDNQTNEVILPSRYKNGEENRIGDILREAFSEGRHIFNRNGSCNSAVNGDKVILKPFFKWIECEGKKTQHVDKANKNSAKVTHRDQVTELMNNLEQQQQQPHTTTTDSLAADIKYEVCGDKNLDEFTDDCLDSNDNNNNIAIKDETSFSSFESCDDEHFELSDDRIQALLMPLVIQFLSDE